MISDTEQHRQDTLLSLERNVILGQKLNSLCLRRSRRRPTFFPALSFLSTLKLHGFAISSFWSKKSLLALGLLAPWSSKNNIGKGITLKPI